MGFSGQEHRSRLPFLSPGDLPDPEIESGSPHWQTGSPPPCHQGSPNFPYSSSFSIPSSFHIPPAEYLMSFFIHIQCHKNPTPLCPPPSTVSSISRTSHTLSSGFCLKAPTTEADGDRVTVLLPPATALQLKQVSVFFSLPPQP